MKYLIYILFFIVLSCGTKHIITRSETYTVRVKRIHKTGDVVTVYYLLNNRSGAKIESDKDKIQIRYDDYIKNPMLFVSDDIKEDTLKRTKDVLSRKFELVLPMEYEIKEK